MATLGVGRAYGSLPIGGMVVAPLPHKGIAMEFIDSHTHLAYDSFTGEEADLIERARAAGIVHAVNPGITEASTAKALELAEQFPAFLSVGIGIHPNDAPEWQPETFARFQTVGDHPAVVAVGETGLDYYRTWCGPEVQQDVFRQHIRLARTIGRPIIIHTRNRDKDREADADLLRILDEEGAAEVGGVMHCFSGDWDHAQRSMERNFRISFAGNLTYKNARVLHDVATRVPLDQVLIETDAPFLTPEPMRGKRNEPALVVRVAEKIAELQGLPLAEVAAASAANARSLFRLPGGA
jgi:TatD DNase family protein